MAMLCYLAEHPGRLVTKAELRRHIWGGTHVTDTVLRVSVQEIRAVLGEVAMAPKYLETVGRQGYRVLVGDDRDVAPALLTKALELRAPLSLSRLWRQQGRRQAARELLAPIYGWFTESFDTADLQEAKALLEALS
jgi:predicted ATPase